MTCRGVQVVVFVARVSSPQGVQPPGIGKTILNGGAVHNTIHSILQVRAMHPQPASLLLLLAPPLWPRGTQR
jgi:hypothetical protein